MVHFAAEQVVHFVAESVVHFHPEWVVHFPRNTQRNVKHEDIYLKGYSTAAELQCGLKKYFIEYNVERPHQSLGYSTPVKVYRAAVGGGARIVDKYRKLNKQTEELTVKEEQCLSAA